MGPQPLHFNDSASTWFPLGCPRGPAHEVGGLSGHGLVQFGAVVTLEWKCMLAPALDTCTVGLAPGLMPFASQFHPVCGCRSRLAERGDGGPAGSPAGALDWVLGPPRNSLGTIFHRTPDSFDCGGFSAACDGSYHRAMGCPRERHSSRTPIRASGSVPRRHGPMPATVYPPYQGAV